MVEETLRHPEYSLIVPNSLAASPISITMDISPYLYTSTSSSRLAVGFRFVLSGTTEYSICNMEDPAEVWFSITATYFRKSALSIGASPFSTYGTSRGSRLDPAVAVVQIVSNIK